MKRGQVTLFIIVGLLIVVGVIVFFLWVRPTFNLGGSTSLNFEGCVSESIEEGITTLEKNAGFINPPFTFPYQGNNIAYLCYTNQDLQTCTVQQPFLRSHFEDQLSLYVSDDVDTCYSASIAALKEQGFDVTSGSVDFDITFNPGVVQTKITAPTTVGGATTQEFNVVTNSPIYELTEIAQSVIQFEVEFGDYDTSTLPLLYPDLNLQKLKQGEGTTVYLLSHKTFGNEFRFASRSLVWPVGYLE